MKKAARKERKKNRTNKGTYKKKKQTIYNEIDVNKLFKNLNLFLKIFNSGEKLSQPSSSN